MEFIGITRLIDGKEENQFVACCPEHNFYYKGKPPLTCGCRECWAVFFISEWIIAGAKPEDVDKLESAIKHMAELIDKGEFDFKPNYEFKIDKDN